jgi:hypothetical protein
VGRNRHVDHLADKFGSTHVTLPPYELSKLEYFSSVVQKLLSITYV